MDYFPSSIGLLPELHWLGKFVSAAGNLSLAEVEKKVDHLVRYLSSLSVCLSVHPFVDTSEVEMHTHTSSMLLRREMMARGKEGREGKKKSTFDHETSAFLLMCDHRHFAEKKKSAFPDRKHRAWTEKAYFVGN